MIKNSEKIREPVVKIVHFDRQYSLMNDQLTRLQRDTENLVQCQSVPPCAESWAQFTRAITTSKANILIPTLHGRSDGTIGPGPSDSFRDPAEIFSKDSIQAESLILYCCNQWDNRNKWKSIAPNSKIALHDSNVSGIIRIVNFMLAPTSRRIPNNWNII